LTAIIRFNFDRQDQDDQRQREYILHFLDQFCKIELHCLYCCFSKILRFAISELFIMSRDFRMHWLATGWLEVRVLPEELRKPSVSQLIGGFFTYAQEEMGAIV
jgi:hypothetical protein